MPCNLVMSIFMLYLGGGGVPLLDWTVGERERGTGLGDI